MTDYPASTARDLVAASRRIDSDVNGNPRYYVPRFLFPPMTTKVRRAAGLMEYRGKRYGAGLVVQSYSLESDLQFALNIIAEG